MLSIKSLNETFVEVTKLFWKLTLFILAGLGMYSAVFSAVAVVSSDVKKHNARKAAEKHWMPTWNKTRKYEASYILPKANKKGATGV